LFLNHGSPAQMPLPNSSTTNRWLAALAHINAWLYSASSVHKKLFVR
jgi:hypothetical protein